MLNAYKKFILVSLLEHAKVRYGLVNSNPIIISSSVVSHCEINLSILLLDRAPNIPNISN